MRGCVRPAQGRLPITVAVLGLRGVPNVIGGIETHCEQLYPVLKRTAGDIAPHLIARRRYVSARRSSIRGVPVTALPSPRGAAVETLIHTGLAVIYARLRLRSRILHIHGIGPAFFAPLARVLGAKVVVTHHAADFQRPKWRAGGRLFLRLGETFAALCAHRIVCVSDALRSEFLLRHPTATKRTSVIRHGTQLAQFDEAGADRLLEELGLQSGAYVLAVGRLEETKRFSDLIAAQAAAGPRAMPLLIVGSAVGNADHSAALMRQAGEGVRFAGFRNGAELVALYRSAAVFVHASEMEGFGLVALEAIIAGAPVRLSDIPAHREFGLPNSHYFRVGDIETLAELFKPENHPFPRPTSAIGLLERYNLAAAAAAYAALFRALDSKAVPPTSSSRSGFRKH